MQLTFQSDISCLKGIDPKKAILLGQELSIYNLSDLVQYYPFRYEDRSMVHHIKDIKTDLPYVQLRGYLQDFKVITTGKKRLIAYLTDDTGTLELVWFQKLGAIIKYLRQQTLYQVIGKPIVYQGKYRIIHPELTVYVSPLNNSTRRPIPTLLPVYHVTEKLKAYHIDSRYIKRIQANLQATLPPLKEILSTKLQQQYHLIDKRTALINIHFPASDTLLKQARYRLIFEELFFLQLRLLLVKQLRLERHAGIVYNNTQLLRHFYNQHLPFVLTNGQKKVVKEIYQDLKSGKQMNRLLQGDVGSGKTIVAFLAMLLVIGSNNQAVMMAPTEILAEQHYQRLLIFARALSLEIALLTGATKTSERKHILAKLAQGDIHLVVGTHSLINEQVQFKHLGLAVIDEQHRFGVAQRAQLWKKSSHTDLPPHILVMSATPIPRTLAMTLYGDLAISVIDELPSGRKPIKTYHYFDAQRLKVFHFVNLQIKQGRQAYFVYPLIEASEKLTYKNLIEGYESICRAFPNLPISIIHGKMKADDKAFEMGRFVRGETKIMVATTVIEVGVNVPNASVMVIENADRFGLAQLHQLRGRVGRGADQSYCILMTDYKLSVKSRERIKIIVNTNDGFELADKDLRLRGPGDITGVQQSGLMNLKIADLRKDGQILRLAREAACQVIAQDPHLEAREHAAIKFVLDHTKNSHYGTVG